MDLNKAVSTMGMKLNKFRRANHKKTIQRNKLGDQVANYLLKAGFK
jgi:hypothetical protein